MSRAQQHHPAARIPSFKQLSLTETTVLQNTEREASSGVQSSRGTTVLSHLKRYNNLDTLKHTL